MITASIPATRGRRPDRGRSAGVDHPQDPGRRRGQRRSPRRAGDRPQAPQPAARPRLPGGDDAQRPDLHARRRRRRRPREVLQPPPGGLMIRIHADRSPTPRTHGVSTLYPAWRRGWTSDIYRPSLRAAGVVHRNVLHQDDRRREPWPCRAQRPHGVQLGERAGDPRRDRLLLEPHRAAESSVGARTSGALPEGLAAGTAAFVPAVVTDGVVAAVCHNETHTMSTRAGEHRAGRQPRGRRRRTRDSGSAPLTRPERTRPRRTSARSTVCAELHEARRRASQSRPDSSARNGRPPAVSTSSASRPGRGSTSARRLWSS